jgi:polyisoprenoid-binding protein YceI
MARRRRRWTRWLIGGVAVIVILVVGGPFVYIHFIEGKAPPPLSLSTETTPTTASSSTGAAQTGSTTTAAGAADASASSSSVEGTWKVSTGSVAGYRIKETLFGQSNTAVGRTSSITGSITISGTQVASGQFTVDMTTVKSDQTERDHQFQGRIMDTATFPTSTFVLTQPIQLGSIPAAGTTITETATGKLTLHGTTKTVTFPVQARLSGTTISVSGSIPIVFADYGIDNPSGGPATTSNNGTLEFLLNLARTAG